MLQPPPGRRFSAEEDAAGGFLDALARTEGVVGLLSRRLDRLEPGARALLDAGAVWGRVWSQAEAAQAAGLSDEEALDGVGALLARQIVVETGDGGLRFAHDRLREVVYDRLPTDARARLHRRVATELEARDARGVAGNRSIALHFRLAGSTSKAFHYSALAGRLALQQGAHHEAIEELEAALRLLSAPGSTVMATPMERATLYRGLGDALYVAGDLMRMGDRLAAGVDALGLMHTPRTDRAWALRALGDLVRRALVAVLPASLVLARGEHRSLIAANGYLLSRLAEPYLYSDRPVAYLAGNLAASVYGARSQDSDTIAWVDVVLGAAVSAMGLPSLAGRLVAHARLHAERSDNIDVQLYHAAVEAYFWSMQLDWDHALEVLEAALARGRAVGASFRTEGLLTVRAMVQSQRGEVPLCIASARELVASARTWGHWLHEAQGELLLGLALVQNAELHESREALTVAARMLHKPHLAVQRANCHAGLAQICLLSGDLDGALREAAMVEELVPRLAPTNTVAVAIHRYLPVVRLAALERARRQCDPTEALDRQTMAAVEAAARYARHMPSARPSALRQQAVEVPATHHHNFLSAPGRTCPNSLCGPARPRGLTRAPPTPNRFPDLLVQPPCGANFVASEWEVPPTLLRRRSIEAHRHPTRPRPGRAPGPRRGCCSGSARARSLKAMRNNSATWARGLPLDLP